MSDDDNLLGFALWLAAGGAAGYAAGRWLGRRPEQTRAMQPTALPSHAGSATPRALAGPSGLAMPIDPYASAIAAPVSAAPYAGPSGSMRPIDPYAEDPTDRVPTLVSTVSAPNAVMPKQPPTISTTPSITTPASAPSAPVLAGPITRPSQLGAIGSVSGLTPSANESTGAITSPSQVPLPTTTASVALPPSPIVSTKFATSARVRRFDSVFARYRGSIPIEYVRALVERESNGQPSARTGQAVGLMQIVPVVLDDYNKRHGTTYHREQLVDPAINVAIGCELLRVIVASYRRNHPRIRTLYEDWDNPRFVELVTLGYNAGFSEAGGVGRVARYLASLGAVEIDIDQVSAHAILAGASKHLANPAKVAWCKGVVALYLRERALARPLAVS